MADSDFAQLLSEYAALTADDRRAVEQLLSSAERRQLKSFFDRNLPQERTKEAPQKDALANVGAYSPWLAKRLARIATAPSNASDITPRALELVLKTLTLHETPGARRP